MKPKKKENSTQRKKNTRWDLTGIEPNALTQPTIGPTKKTKRQKILPPFNFFAARSTAGHDKKKWITIASLVASINLELGGGKRHPAEEENRVGGGGQRKTSGSSVHNYHNDAMYVQDLQECFQRLCIVLEWVCVCVCVWFISTKISGPALRWQLRSDWIYRLFFWLSKKNVFFCVSVQDWRANA